MGGGLADYLLLLLFAGPLVVDVQAVDFNVVTETVGPVAKVADVAHVLEVFVDELDLLAFFGEVESQTVEEVSEVGVWLCVGLADAPGPKVLEV